MNITYVDVLIDTANIKEILICHNAFEFFLYFDIKMHL